MIALQPVHDRRTTPRIPIGNLAAHIDVRDGSDPIMVCVWDISLGGACLIVPPGHDIPERFDLVIGGRSHPVERMWQRSSSVGVRLQLVTVPSARAA